MTYFVGVGALVSGVGVGGAEGWGRWRWRTAERGRHTTRGSSTGRDVSAAFLANYHTMNIRVAWTRVPTACTPRLPGNSMLSCTWTSLTPPSPPDAAPHILARLYGRAIGRAMRNSGAGEVLDRGCRVEVFSRRRGCAGVLHPLCVGQVTRIFHLVAYR
jgi:hypothetical protein